MLRFLGSTFLLLLIILGLPASAPPAAGAAAVWQEAASELELLTSYSAAVELYERVANIQPFDPDPLVAIGNIYLRQANWLMAVDAFNRALARQANYPAALKGMGAAFWGAAENERAVNTWRLVLAIQPDDFDVRMRLGRALIDQGDLAEGIAILETLVPQVDSVSITEEASARIELDLAIAEAATDPSRALNRLQSFPADVSLRTEEVRQYLLASLSDALQAPEAADQARLIGIALAQLQAWAPAAEALQKAISLQPDDAEAMAFLGYVENRRGRPAYNSLTSATTIDPDNWVGHYFLGQYLVEADLPALGIDELEKSRILAPDNPAILVALSGAYMALGDYAAAETALEQAVSLAPADLSVHRRLVNFYTATSLRATENGLAAASAATKLAPEDPELQDALGWIYLLAGDTHRAFLHLYTAWQLDPSRASTYYHLGRLYQVNGQEETATTAFRRAVDLDDGGEYRARAQQALQEQTK